MNPSEEFEQAPPLLSAEATRTPLSRPPEAGEAAAVELLERLPPPERVVFVLREIFGCDLPRTASTVGCSEAHCRRLAGTVSQMGEPVSWPARINGPELVSRALAAIVPALLRIGVTVEQQEIRRSSGAVFRDRGGEVLSTLALDILDGRIQSVRWG